VKKDIRVIRMIAAVSFAFFGSLWIALRISGEVAPPEPEIAKVLKPAFLILCIASAIWGVALYIQFRQSERTRAWLDRDGSKGA
jgi:hypothetical protein